MNQLELTEDQQRVYTALAERETERGPAREDELAHECGLDLATVRRTLRELTDDNVDLVRELSPEAPDQGPRYELKERP